MAKSSLVLLPHPPSIHYERHALHVGDLQRKRVRPHPGLERVRPPRVCAERGTHLFSLSDILFKVHKANLASSSTVFRDIFALPNSEEGEIEMAEDEEVLGKILAYCYPDDVPRFVVGSYGWRKVCRAMDKYQVRIRIRQESHSAEEAGRFDEDSRPLREDSSESQHPICVLH